MKKTILFAAAMTVLATMSCSKEETEPSVEPQETFSVLTLNVDGLPKTIGVGMKQFDVNPDGPGEEYSSVIGVYLADKHFDFIGVQENFNYDKQIFMHLAESYNRDVWGGEIRLDKLNGLRFNTDGINGFWKKEISAKRTDSITWKAGYGLFDHGWDAIIAKGFRRYDLKLKGGSKIVIYNMHMDAGDTEDEITGNDGPDQRARMVQWRQLRDYILDHIDTRPVIVMGDLNSWYERDSIKAQFIDYITATGRATVSDVWIEMERDGAYPVWTDEIVFSDPDASDWSRNGETLDKILYLNPIGGSYLKPLSVNIDSISYVKRDGTPLGDHNPLSASFEIINKIE